MKGTALQSRVFSYLDALELSWSAIAVYGCASIIGGFITLAPSNAGTWRIVLAVTVATTLAIVLLVGLRGILNHFLGERAVGRFIGFLVVAAAVGASRGLVLSELSTGAVAGFSPIVSSMFAAILWLTLGAALFAGRDRYQRRYRSLLLQVHSPATTDWDRHPSVQQVKSNVALALGGTDVDVSHVAHVIREEIETNIRPLSHRLWFGADGEVPRARWTQLVHDASAGFVVPLGAVVTIWFLGGLIGGTQLFGVIPGLLSTVFSTSFLILAVLACRRRLPRRAGWGLAGFAVISIITIFGSDVALTLLGISSQMWSNPSLLVLLPITVFGLLVVSSAISLAEADRAVILNVVEEKVRTNVHTVQHKRDSTFLHNSFQAELTGLALQLEQAAKSGSETEAAEALERVHAMLARSVSQDFREVTEAPQVRLTRVVDAWQGICDVTIHVDDQAVKAPQFALAVHIAEEMISNAVRHGGAHVIRIDVTAHDGRLRVMSESDSVGPPLPAQPGLGSDLFASVTREGAVVTHEHGRSRVFVDLD